MLKKINIFIPTFCKAFAEKDFDTLCNLFHIPTVITINDGVNKSTKGFIFLRDLKEYVESDFNDLIYTKSNNRLNKFEAIETQIFSKSLGMTKARWVIMDDDEEVYFSINLLFTLIAVDGAAKITSLTFILDLDDLK